MDFKLWSRQAQPKRIINIGLDFGTSSSKMIWRDVTGDRQTLLGFKNGASGYPPVCLPSSVRISGDRVLFGSAAEADQGPGWLVRSLKVCVACRAGAVTCRGCQPSGAEKRNGQFSLSRDARAGSIGADDLAALLVAYMMRTARERVEAGFKPAKDATFTWNMSAPLDQYEFGRLRGEFERIAYIGSRVAADVRSGMKLTEGLEMVGHARRAPQPPQEELPVAIVPEAIAAVHAYCQSPIATEGLYALIDVGAGTTTVSFFRYHQASAKPITCYSSRTDAVGADDVDRAIFAAVEERFPSVRTADSVERTNVLHEIRLAKENLAGGLRLSNGCALSRGDVQGAIEPIIRRMFDVYVSAFRKAYKKEAFSSRWATVTLLFVGGGALVPGVKEAFANPPDPIVERRAIRVLELPEHLTVDGFERKALTSHNESLLTVAFGLSFPRVDIPEYWETSEVEPIGPQFVRSRGPEDWRE